MPFNQTIDFSVRRHKTVEYSDKKVSNRQSFPMISPSPIANQTDAFAALLDSTGPHSIPIDDCLTRFVECASVRCPRCGLRRVSRSPAFLTVLDPDIGLHHSPALCEVTDWDELPLVALRLDASEPAVEVTDVDVAFEDSEVYYELSEGSL
jgi:hypothetical protein